MRWITSQLVHVMISMISRSTGFQCVLYGFANNAFFGVVDQWCVLTWSCHDNFINATVLRNVLIQQLYYELWSCPLSSNWTRWPIGTRQPIDLLVRNDCYRFGYGRSLRAPFRLPPIQILGNRRGKPASLPTVQRKKPCRIA